MLFNRCPSKRLVTLQRMFQVDCCENTGILMVLPPVTTLTNKLCYVTDFRRIALILVSRHLLTTKTMPGFIIGMMTAMVWMAIVMTAMVMMMMVMTAMVMIMRGPGEALD